MATKDPKETMAIGPLWRSYMHTADLLREAQNNHLKAETLGREAVLLRTIAELAGQLSYSADSLARSLKSFTKDTAEEEK